MRTYRNDRQYARDSQDRTYERRKSIEARYNPISNELYSVDYEYLKTEQQRRVKELYDRRESENFWKNR